MKSIFFTGLLIATILLASLAVAAVSLTLTTAPQDLTKSRLNTTFQVESAGENADFSVVSPITISGNGGSFSATVINTSSQSGVHSAQYMVNVVSSAVRSLPFGTYSGTARVTATNASTNSMSNFDVPIIFRSGFCSSGPQGINLTISDVNIDGGSGTEDEDWVLHDDIEIEVDVSNDGSNDLDDITLELALFDAQGRDKVGELDFENDGEEEIDVGSIDEDAEETVIFRFTVPADFDKDNYRLALKAYEDGKENTLCADEFEGSTFTEISVEGVDSGDEDEDAVVVDNIELPTQASCGETVTGTFRVFNIGDRDEDQVLIQMRSTALGVSQEFVFRGGLDEGDDRRQDFNFDIPDTIRDGTYTVEFQSFYDYNDNRNTYDEESDDAYTGSMQIIGCSPSNDDNTDGDDTGAPVSITASLDSDAQQGESMVVTARVRNTGSEDATIVIDASGYEDWAELEDISSRVLDLGAGESATVVFTFTVNEDTDGAQSFFIEAESNGETEVQEVEVMIESPGNGFNLDFGNNGLIWIIGAVNVILLILVIVVAVRLSQR